MIDLASRRVVGFAVAVHMRAGLVCEALEMALKARRPEPGLVFHSAEVDEEAWSQLYSTRSFPFDRPASGKVAVKVINHYGDEVLKVYEV